MRFSEKRIRTFQRVIFDWWGVNRRDLPWRHTHDPYHILVSEMMLQQTQVLRVLPKYQKFLDAFPTVYALARAKTADVLRAWKGMGYNRRALYLKQTAERVVSEYKGIFPENEALLRKFPGVGVYTARAILVFSYKKDIAMVDTNIRHIITHFFFHDIPQKDIIIQSTADQLVPKRKSWEWHQALMDYGAEYNAKFKIQNAKLKKEKVPFRETKRFFRGRVIDYLRDKTYSKDDLMNILKMQFQKDKIFYQGICDDLVTDGLVEYKNNHYQLAE